MSSAPMTSATGGVRWGSSMIEYVGGAGTIRTPATGIGGADPFAAVALAGMPTGDDRMRALRDPIGDGDVHR